ncbi:hypothetical protein LVD15_26190 [Fulvivirga maritima]|nr:hypothetical protein [Fulvivirga maritima]UII26744.1 hypothetical protein LVD15_26190 [Fulvivirga maritima]
MIFNNNSLTSIFVQTIVKGENQVIIQAVQNGATVEPEIIRELSSTIKMK